MANPDDLGKRFARYVVSPDLIDDLKSADGPGSFSNEVNATEAPSPPRPPRLIIELNGHFPGGLPAARQEALARLADFQPGRLSADEGSAFIFARLTFSEVAALVEGGEGPSPVYKIWRDQKLKPFIDRSLRTIKADACITAFGADGEGIVVAVADSGIDGAHPHFAKHETVTNLPRGLEHRDFTEEQAGPLVDRFGHGTHVAGIVAGWTPADMSACRVGQVRELDGTVRWKAEEINVDLRGVAPRAKVVSLKVLDSDGDGYESTLIQALEHVAHVNEHGRRLRIHVVNLSLGYTFNAEWFAAGHSPLCVIVNRLSRLGVVMVVAAGNDGSVMLQAAGRPASQRYGLDISINDPGNAEEAITVGATHGESPHRYGVSYFSSRGPTADGRIKPDLVAPGERILSCASQEARKFKAALSEAKATLKPSCGYFQEESGTSMAAPHVAGAVAAFLSVRREFIGRPDAVKEIFLDTCTDLKRKPDFQGAGLIDLLRAMQSV